MTSASALNSITQLITNPEDVKLLQKLILLTQLNQKFDKMVILHTTNEPKLHAIVNTIKSHLPIDSVTVINGSDIVTLSDLIDDKTKLVMYDGQNKHSPSTMKDLFNSESVTTRKLFEEQTIVKLNKTNHLLFTSSLDQLDDNLKKECIVISA